MHTKGAYACARARRALLTFFEVEHVHIVVEAGISLAGRPAAAAHDNEQATRKARAVVGARLRLRSTNVRNFTPRPSVELEKVAVHEIVARGARPAEAAHDCDLVLGQRQIITLLGVHRDQIGRVMRARVRGRTSGLLNVPLHTANGEDVAVVEALALAQAAEDEDRFLVGQQRGRVPPARWRHVAHHVDHLPLGGLTLHVAAPRL